LKRSQGMPGRSVRAFLDANTIVSGLLFHGNEAVLLELGRYRALELYSNNYVLGEVVSVLGREEFSLSREEIRGLTSYHRSCIVVLEDPSWSALRENIGLLDDKKDIPVALGALESGVDYLVTGDKELPGSEEIPAITTSKLLDEILSDER